MPKFLGYALALVRDPPDEIVKDDHIGFRVVLLTNGSR